ncbi:cupin domain-containing protein [Agrobacterium vitis]|nr:cupin domain-containing protein [Agrobacterium vitis]
MYDAPNHFGVVGRRLQGLDAGGAQNYWIGVSEFAPGGGAGPDAGGIEKSYVILSGEMTLRADGQTVTLGVLDSVTIDAGTERQIINETDKTATMLVIAPRVV